MDEMITALEAMSVGAIIWSFIKIIIVVMIVLAIFDMSASLKTIKQEEEKQTRILEDIQRNTINNNLILMNKNNTPQ